MIILEYKLNYYFNNYVSIIEIYNIQYFKAFFSLENQSILFINLIFMPFFYLSGLCNHI